MNVSKYFFLDASIQLALVIALHTCILVILGKANSRDVFQSEEDHAHWSTGARILIGCLWFWWGVRVGILFSLEFVSCFDLISLYNKQ